MANLHKPTTAGLLLAVLAATAGCATTSDLDALRSEVQKANATAERAEQDAAAAKTAAEKAQSEAEETNEKLDRMFKKSMYK
jgi:outer membrane murein-binding lipoprotein Lpp